MKSEMSINQNISSNLETFSDEVLFEIFDRLSPRELFEKFYGLNKRLNTILNDSRMRFRDNLSSLPPREFDRYIQLVLPRIMNRLVSFTFGNYDTDEYQQVNRLLHFHRIDLSLFKHLRTLVIIKMAIVDVATVQTAFANLENLANIRLSVDSNDVEANSVVHINNNLLARPKLKRVKLDMCARTTFQNVNQLSNVEDLSIVWCQMQELTYLLRHATNLQTLKATIFGLDDAEHWTQTIQGSLNQPHPLRLSSLKLVIDSIGFDSLILLLNELPRLRSLWLLLNHHEYLDADKWQTLLKTSLTQLDQLDLTIALTKPLVSTQNQGQFLPMLMPQIAFNKFKTSFWLDHGWGAKLEEYDQCIRLTVSNISISI